MLTNICTFIFYKKKYEYTPINVTYLSSINNYAYALSCYHKSTPVNNLRYLTYADKERKRLRYFASLSFCQGTEFIK